MDRWNSRIYSGVSVLSLLIVSFLVWLVYLRNGIPESNGLLFLPEFNAGMNGIATIAIVTGILAIKSGKKVKHAISMASATFASALFFIGYTIHHYLSGDTKFVGHGISKLVYLMILASHIALSAAVVPMILLTLIFAGTRQFERHKKIAVYTYPVWLYVSVTGVVVYLFLKLSGSI